MLWNDVHRGLEKPARKRWQQRTDVPGTGWELGRGCGEHRWTLPDGGDAVP